MVANKSCREYRNRYGSWSAEAERWHRHVRRIDRGKRLFLFSVIGYTVFDPTVAAVLVPAAALLVGVVLVQNRAIRRQERADRLVRYYDRLLARFNDRWQDQGDAGTRYVTDAHVFANDLDVFGRGSLFELIAIAGSELGRDTLAQWLLTWADAATIRARQEAVRELAGDLDGRERLLLAGSTSDRIDRWSLDAIRAMPMRLPTWLARVIAWTFVAQLAPAVLFGGWWWGAFAGAGLVVAIAALGQRDRLEPLHRHGRRFGHTLSALVPLAAEIRRRDDASGELRTIRACLSDRPLPNRSLALMLGTLLPYRPLMYWFAQLVPAFETWRGRLAASAAQTADAVGRFETIMELASYAYEHPRDSFPEIVEAGPCFDAMRLRHPLLAASKCVPNDVRLDDHVRLLLISGSNMSGKSTLLRSVGLNSVLARTGAPVCATECRVAPMLIGSSMRLQDSLAEGTSYFLAVIKRLRLVMELLGQRRPVLFLLDEILQGTNSRDRRIGARAIICKLIDSGAIGLITTHDLELTKLADELEGRARNVHFSDQVVDGQMSFDYQMKLGVVRSSNALPLMRSMGLDV